MFTRVPFLALILCVGLAALPGRVAASAGTDSSASGQVNPDGTARGIVITVDIGRPSQGCGGFGFCGITIGASASARAVPTAATWVNGRLLMDFLSAPPDKTDLVTVEKDIVLDGATARALGYEQVTVRAGQYPVDYTVNPLGQVSPDVTALGLVITVEIGRRSQGCTGFGICSITVDPLASARAVPTAATWVNGRLLLDFLSEPPDKTNVVTIEKDIILDSATARALGYEQVSVRAGQYPVDYSVNPHGQVSPDATAQGIVITLHFGIPSRDCTGFGFCGITIEPSASARAVPTAATWMNGRLWLDFLSEPPDKTNVVTVEKDIVLDSATARALGYEQVSVRAGQYPVDYSVNPHGQVSPDLTAQGIVITLNFGIPSRDCTGFGFCGITIEPSASARAVPTAATWANGRLLLDFLSEPPDKTNVVTVEKDIVLDSATARALGYEQVSVRAGQYPVDYSVNPHGQVSPDVTAQGIVITLHFGIPSRDCTGFGFCGITIEPSASARAVPTAATWVNGRLLLDFLSEPPDKTNVVTVEKDIVLDSATARALGYEQVSVRAGQYPVDYSVNPHGQVSPDVTAQGIVITLHFGIPSRDCTGFGFCGITIEPSASARAVPTAATWVNGRLLLDFLSEPPDKTNVVTVEKDIVLDSATARALGYEQVSVRAGQYPVDYSVNPHGQASPDVTALGFVITVDIGLPSQRCTGFGICSITIGPLASARSVPTAATWVNGRLLLDFLSELPDKTNVVTVEKDIVLDSATARALGYEQVSVRAGQYPVDYSVNPHGQASPDVTALGFVITVDIGLPSQRCTGFGICSITIGPLASARSVPTAATWVNGRLLLDFLSELPDKTNVVTVEKDIVLDSATARALGYEKLSVLAGQYPVDYSMNPHGQVSPDVTAAGIVITIHIGRESRGCVGFGFCGITIEPSASARAVPTAARWLNGRLLLDFLSEPPDKADLLTIEKDIALDSTTARALGYEKLSVRAGQYPVDYTVNPHGQVSPDVTAAGIVITLHVGLPSQGCTGFGFCGITIELSASARAVPAAATWVNGRLLLDFLLEPPDKTNVVTIEKDIVLDSATARALGYKQVSVRAGQYPVDYSVNPHGQVSPDVTAAGIVITIEVGRPSRGCGGFGICSITIDPFASARAVPTAATWMNGRLQLDFLSEPPDKTNLLTIEKDIVLDSATARALGYEQVSVRAGQYPVDYSVNPHGQASPDVTAAGIVITVHIGRQSRDCTGFGFCGITIETSASARAVPTAATWMNGRLWLDFLSEPPDKTNVVTIEKDIVLESATARALGYEQVSVRAGQYPVDYSVNPHGQVSPDVTAQGIVITVHIGRQSRDCTGFGFCGLTIETSASARAVPTAATWVNGRLLLDFLSEPPDKTNLVTIEKDIVLDSATARALGYEQVSVRAGQYPVDYSVNPHGQVSPDVTAQGIVITLHFGIPSRDCTGFGFCGITIETSASARAVPTAATWANGRLLLDFLSEPPDKTNVVTVEKDIVLDSATARALGYKQVSVRAGQYPVDYSVNPHGQVSPDVTALGLVITVEVGRPSQGCTGFGICSITIDPLASTRVIATAATWTNGRLQLDFLSEPPDKTNVMTIEKDMVLDSATARALGYEQVSVRAGQYPVDYSVNPHGQVSPDVTAAGIIITIDFGLRSLGCTGFGICSITIDPLASARAVSTAARWANGRLLLDFLSEPPDKTNLLIIEKDIVLDSATARALGYEQVSVRAGQYPVDYSVNPHGQVSPDVTAAGLVITIDFGLPSRGCTGFGICNITTTASVSARAMPTAGAWVKGRLLFDFLSEPPDKTNLLIIEKDIVLDSATARALGYEQVTVRAGQYSVDYSVNSHGQVSPDVTAAGLVINVEIGRPSRGCTGFGICSITIDPLASTRAVPTAATWVNGRLAMDFLSEPPDKANLLTIEKDILLDGAAARALGYEQVSVRAGQYPVDYSANPHGQVSPDVTALGLVITVDIGVPSQRCTGFGICSITIGPLASARAVATAATWVNGRLQFDFLSEPSDKTNLLTIEKDIVLDSATARALGYEQVSVRAGQYPVDYSANPHGQVSPDVTAQGIVITVEIGRPSRGCGGFGICSITIDALASARAIPAAAAWTNGRLQLDFLAEPLDKTNLLTIEKDIALDSATARALGFDQLSVRAGQYPVDYTVNPHGQVSPDVTAQGIVITVHIGLPSRNCTGFGFCGITIEPSATARGVPTLATWVNGRLQLNFLSDPPDKTNLVTVEKDIVLDSATAQALGYEQVTVHAGQYLVDYSVNPHGQVSPDVAAAGIVINIDIGRPSRNCAGFGICSITIGASASARAVPTAAAWTNGRLQLDFLAEPPDKTNLVTIEKDIVLDSATSRALGYEQVSVRAGQYPVDYTVNPHGQVSPDVAAAGIVINIDIGRPSRNCAGFGICSITIGASASARGVPAGVTWVDGHLQLHFLAEPLDKTNLFTIEKDIVLDSATSRALGYEQISVRAGEYSVDYSRDPNGQVTPEATVTGFTAGRNANGILTITWPANGWTLQEADGVSGPWTNSATQTSPLTLGTDAGRKFYRLTSP